MTLLKEFQDFIARGNAMDMAVGVIIGTAFGKIIASLVNDVLMPPIGLILGNAPLKSLILVLKPAETLVDGTVVPAVAIAYGLFIQAIIDFLLITACVFLLIKCIQKIQNAPKESAPAAPPEDVQLLRDIRDTLRQQHEKSIGVL